MKSLYKIILMSGAICIASYGQLNAQTVSVGGGSSVNANLSSQITKLKQLIFAVSDNQKATQAELDTTNSELTKFITCGDQDKLYNSTAGGDGCVSSGSNIWAPFAGQTLSISNSCGISTYYAYGRVTADGRPQIKSSWTITTGYGGLYTTGWIYGTSARYATLSTTGLTVTTCTPALKPW